MAQPRGQKTLEWFVGTEFLKERKNGKTQGARGTGGTQSTKRAARGGQKSSDNDSKSSWLHHTTSSSTQNSNSPQKRQHSSYAGAARVNCIPGASSIIPATTTETTVPPSVPPTVSSTVPPTVPSSCYHGSSTVPPTVPPTVARTVARTVPPTVPRTVLPTVPHTILRTVPPTVLPTVLPTVPSSRYHGSSTVLPTVLPTVPSSRYHGSSTVLPTVPPTVLPTVPHTVPHTVLRTVPPTVLPTVPSSRYHGSSTVLPAVLRTVLPTVLPTVPRTVLPTLLPTVLPTVPRTVRPTVIDDDYWFYDNGTGGYYYYLPGKKGWKKRQEDDPGPKEMERQVANRKNYIPRDPSGTPPQKQWSPRNLQNTQPRWNRLLNTQIPQINLQETIRYDSTSDDYYYDQETGSFRWISRNSGQILPTPLSESSEYSYGSDEQCSSEYSEEYLMSPTPPPTPRGPAEYVWAFMDLFNSAPSSNESIFDSEWLESLKMEAKPLKSDVELLDAIMADLKMGEKKLPNYINRNSILIQTEKIEFIPQRRMERRRKGWLIRPINRFKRTFMRLQKRMNSLETIEENLELEEANQASGQIPPTPPPESSEYSYGSDEQCSSEYSEEYLMSPTPPPTPRGPSEYIWAFTDLFSSAPSSNESIFDSEWLESLKMEPKPLKSDDELLNAIMADLKMGEEKLPNCTNRNSILTQTEKIEIIPQRRVERRRKSRSIRSIIRFKRTFMRLRMNSLETIEENLELEEANQA